jgi:hypothetical protein
MGSSLWDVLHLIKWVLVYGMFQHYKKSLSEWLLCNAGLCQLSNILAISCQEQVNF